MKWANLVPWSSKPMHAGEATSPPAHPIDRMRWEMDRLFDSFTSDLWGGKGFSSGLQDWCGWAPAVDVKETETEMTVRAEIPGVEPKALELSVSGDALTISGTKEEKKEGNEQGVYHSECTYGSFQRVIPLPEGADAENATAEHANGVLTVRIAKRPGAAPKRIDVKAS
jgi:HSP20 family protein